MDMHRQKEETVLDKQRERKAKEIVEQTYNWVATLSPLLCRIAAAFGSFFVLSLIAAFSADAALVTGLVVLAGLIGKFVSLVVKELK